MPFPHSYIKLTDTELKITEKELERYALERNMPRRNRLLILLLSHLGNNYRQIAERRRPPFSIMTVRRCIYRYRKEGLKPFVHKDVFP